MNYVIKSIALFLWTVFVPFLIGMLPSSLLPQKRRTPGMVLLTGYFVMFAIFEIIGLPILFFTEYGNFTLLTVLFTIITLALAMAGYVVTGGINGVNWIPFHIGAAESESGAVVDSEESGTIDKTAGNDSDQVSRAVSLILWIVFLGLLIYEFYMAFTHLFFDGDDAYYVVQSVITWQTNTMYHYLPYTGGPTILDIRHAMAMFPMWVAYLARISTMHPTAIAHSFLPMVFISLSDLVLLRIASNLFEAEPFRKRRSELLPMFMVAVALLQIFGNTSIYTPETFLMMRSWQGKSVFVNFVIPSIFLLFLRINAEEKENDAKARLFYWCCLFAVDIAAGLCSTMAALFAIGIVSLTGLITAISLKKRKIIGKTLLCIAPDVIYLAVYLVMTKLVY